MIFILIVLLIFGCLGGGYFGRERFGGVYQGGGVGLGAVLLLCAVIWLCGGFGSFGHIR
jgi:hypothetical protein